MKTTTQTVETVIVTPSTTKFRKGLTAAQRTANRAARARSMADLDAYLAGKVVTVTMVG